MRTIEHPMNAARGSVRPVAAAVFLALVAGCGDRIQHGLDERQANELEAVLIERGIAARKVPEPGKKPTWALEVDDADATDAVRVLADLGLPRPRAEGFEEVFGKGSLVPSPTEERALFLEALSGEVSRTLESVGGVVSARVHLVLPGPALAGQPTPPPKASALLRVLPSQMGHLGQARAELRALVAGSVEGLRVDDVVIVLDEVALKPARPRGQPRHGPLGAIALVLGLVAAFLGGAGAALAAGARARRAPGTALPGPTVASIRGTASQSRQAA